MKRCATTALIASNERGNWIQQLSYSWTIACGRPTSRKPAMVSIAIFELSWTSLIFIEPDIKVNDVYYQDVLLQDKLLAIRSLFFFCLYACICQLKLWFLVPMYAMYCTRGNLPFRFPLVHGRIRSL